MVFIHVDISTVRHYLIQVNIEFYLYFEIKLLQYCL